MPSGPLLFARYAYPPNELGYCGPEDDRELLEQASTHIVDAGLTKMLYEFAGAMPYLRLIAATNGIDDVLDRRVVEAYWIGNDLLAGVGSASLLSMLNDNFRPQLKRGWEDVVALALAGCVPHHNFHVFGVYPWLGLLRGGIGERPLEVLDRCRIRAGVVADVLGDEVIVSSRALVWDGDQIEFGASSMERARWRRDGYAQIEPPEVGASVSLHWDWVCEVLDDSAAARLRSVSAGLVRRVNSILTPERAAPPALAG